MVADPLGGDVTVTWGPTLPTTDIVGGEEGLLQAIWSQDLMSYAQFSDGDKPGIDILYIRKGSAILVFEGYEPITWDSFGRFLATIRQRQVAIVDATDRELYPVGIPLAVVSDIRFSD